jgi:hypothetical protein
LSDSEGNQRVRPPLRKTSPGHEINRPILLMPEARNSGPSALSNALRRASELEALRLATASNDRDDVLNVTSEGRAFGDHCGRDAGRTRRAGTARATTGGGASSAAERSGVSNAATDCLWVRSSHDVDAKAAVPGCCSRTTEVTFALWRGQRKRHSRYLTMSDRHLPAPRSAATPAAAFERELDRAERYAQSALAPSTRRAYEQDWLLFAAWCAERRVVAIPAHPASVAAFLAAEADRGFRPVTIGRRAAGIAAAHRAQDHPNPCDSGTVAAVMSGIRREHGTRPLRKAAPLELDPLARLTWISGAFVRPCLREVGPIRRAGSCS